MSNENLHTAKAVKNDEFYTQLSDIEKEVKYYKDHLRGKVVYCNCDDPLSSNFTKYFILNFHFLGLKKLICTFYDINNIKKAYAFVYEGQDLNGDGRITEDDIEIIRQFKAYQVPLSDDPGFIFEEKKACESRGIYGSGDFRSKNCIEYLKLSDVVITNPPFSLFREYVAQLMEYDKKFLIIGNMNAITFKEIFPLIKDNKLWEGISLNGTKCQFDIPEDYEGKNVFIDKDGKRKAKINNAIWFTNLEHKLRKTPLDLYKTYTGHEDKYPEYDNYEAINVDKVSDIPTDYDGAMGVPITFLYKYCPNQFEIIGLDRYVNGNKYPNKRMFIDGKEIYARILIKIKQ